VYFFVQSDLGDLTGPFAYRDKVVGESLCAFFLSYCVASTRVLEREWIKTKQRYDKYQ
jgi:hypothetical protein